MYPEVSLLGPEGKKVLSFKQDAMDSMNEGFVELWLINEVSCIDRRMKTALTSLSEMMRAQVTALLEQAHLPHEEDIANYPYPINLVANNDTFDALLETDEIPF